MTTSRHVVLRADGGPGIGIGHVVRCITLGNAFRALGCDVTLVSAQIPAALVDDAVDRGLRTAELEPALPVGSEAARLMGLAPDIVVLDGYGFGALASGLADEDVCLVVCDDAGVVMPQRADVILDATFGNTPTRYDALETGLVLAGAEYVGVRPGVVALRGIERPVSDRSTVMVAIGGADPLALSGPIVDAIVQVDGTDVVLVVGPAFADVATLQEQVSSFGTRVRVVSGAMLETYPVTDVAVVGAGITLWECATLGIPTVGVIVADNQVPGAIAAQDAGFSVALDARSDADAAHAVAAVVRELVEDATRRTAMGAAGRTAIDGRGADRAAAAILTACATQAPAAPR